MYIWRVTDKYNDKYNQTGLSDSPENVESSYITLTFPQFSNGHSGDLKGNLRQQFRREQVKYIGY